MRELYDLIDDVSNRLNRNFGIVANSGKMKWIKPEEKAMACKVQFKNVLLSKKLKLCIGN